MKHQKCLSILPAALVALTLLVAIAAQAQGEKVIPRQAPAASAPKTEKIPVAEKTKDDKTAGDTATPKKSTDDASLPFRPAFTPKEVALSKEEIEEVRKKVATATAEHYEQVSNGLKHEKALNDLQLESLKTHYEQVSNGLAHEKALNDLRLETLKTRSTLSLVGFWIACVLVLTSLGLTFRQFWIDAARFKQLIGLASDTRVCHQLSQTTAPAR